MNDINYSNSFKQFPLSTKSLTYANEISKLAYSLALLGGKYYILSGCENTNGNVWSEGLIVVNGELMPFKGGIGSSDSSVRIKQLKEDVIAGYETYPEVYCTRYLEFGTNINNDQTFKWSDFKQIKTISEIVEEFATKDELSTLSNLMMPKGGIIMWSGEVAKIPNGYHLCNGDNVAGFGVVPDLRGRFIVGYDERKLNIPNNLTDQRNANGTVIENYGVIGNNGGKPEIFLTEGQLPKVRLSFDGYSKQESNIADTGNDISSPDKWKWTTQYTNYIGNDESHENRPPYYVLGYIIKVA